MTTGPSPKPQLLDCVQQSWAGRLPTMPRKPLVRTFLRNANPVHPVAIGNVEMRRASSSSSAGRWPSSLLAVSHIPSSWARQ